MAKIIINIPDAEYNYFMSDECFDAQDGFDAIEYICNGTPLPKGHDRLVEAHAVVKALFAHKTIDDVPTIIEADKAESEE